MPLTCQTYKNVDQTTRYTILSTSGQSFMYQTTIYDGWTFAFSYRSYIYMKCKQNYKF